jgi:hypothetical protein
VLRWGWVGFFASSVLFLLATANVFRFFHPSFWVYRNGDPIEDSTIGEPPWTLNPET